MSSPVEKIKDRLKAEEVIGSYVELKRSGSYLRGLCPFHKEKTPSFFVSPDRDSFVCYGCGAKGDIFSFVGKIEGLDFMGTLRLLAERAGVDVSRSNPQADKTRERLFKINEQALDFYSLQLKSNKSALDYLKSRGVRSKTATDWSLGYAPDDWRHLLNHLTKLGFSEDEMVAAGLIKKNQDKTYDTFRARVMFPIRDTVGRVIGFSGRSFPDKPDQLSPKYLNSPDTLVFNKSEVLYGLDKAKDSIRRNNYTVLVEGQFDLILSHQAGMSNAVAVSGTSLSSSHLERLKRLSLNLVTAFDADEAGVKAANRSIVLAFSQGFNVKLADLPEGQDPADLIFEDPMKWKQVLSAAQNPVSYFTNKLTLDQSDKLKVVKELRYQVFPLLMALSSEMERDTLINQLAQQLGVTESAIKSDFSKFSEQSQKESDSEDLPSGKVSSRKMIDPLRWLAALYIWQKQSSQPLVELSVFDQKLDQVGLKDQIREVEDSVDEKEVFDMEVRYEQVNPSQVEKSIDELILYYRIRCLEREFEYSRQKLHQAELGGVGDDVVLHLKECQKISTEISNLKSKIKS